MSAIPENELDLEKLFLPAWAQEPASARQYTQYEGQEAPNRRDDRRGRPPGRRDDRNKGRRDQKRGPEQRRGPRQERGPERGGNREEFRRDRPREPVAPLPEINIQFVPEEKGVESLARQ